MLTLPYKTGRIHLVEHAEDSADCAEHFTHTPLDRKDHSWIEACIRALKQSPMAVSELRRLIGRRGLTYALTRAADHRIAEEIVHLISRGYLTAVGCSLEAPAPAATVSIEGKRFHIGFGIAHVAACDYQRSHRIYRLEDAEATRSLLVKLAGDSEGVREIRRFAARQTDLKDVSRNSSDELFVEQLASLVASRRLTLVECGTNYFGYDGGIGEGEEASRVGARKPAPRSTDGKTPVEEKVKTWIEIKLVDQDGNPVANEAYELKLPDGTVKQGSLDAQGRAKFEEIDPGSCTVSFPGIDGREWKPA